MPEKEVALVIAIGFGHGFCLGPITAGITAAFAQDNEPGLPFGTTMTSLGSANGRSGPPGRAAQSMPRRRRRCWPGLQAG